MNNCKHMSIIGDETGHRCGACGQRMKEEIEECDYCGGDGRADEGRCPACGGSGEGDVTYTPVEALSTESPLADEAKAE